MYANFTNSEDATQIPDFLDAYEITDVEHDPTDNLQLTNEQQAVLDMAYQGENIFLTGAGGCGKTVTLKKLLKSFRELGTQYQVVAPTGIAVSKLGLSPQQLFDPCFLSYSFDIFRAVALQELV
jgi:Cdc6-like AAA superfamily ATPase